MKHITIEKLNIKMDLDFDGNLINLTNEQNGMLFSLNNNDILLNVYLEKKPADISLQKFIDNELKTLRKINFENLKIDFFKEKLKNFDNIKTSQIGKVKTQFKDTTVIMLEKDGAKQLQFYVNMNQYVLIMGLNVLNNKYITEKKFMSHAAIAKLIECINSITSTN
ncbi:MAG: hypothetical protein PHC46_03890 [Clostridia bacterium]|nr:hypothetical protein [Clostridia bacterium]